ncbi:MAG TPA: SDR family NAD(P)-dependent oxidoreductase [Pseudonocardiaceae bacterium]|nr:SDR family NAD(P)-dependent oxidoreductase [Pseudonocardiaceae bacterium]
MTGTELLTGKVVIIAGASRGIGAAAARLFAGEGARLVLGARSGDVLEELAGQLRAGGAEAVAVRADVSTTEGVDALVDAAIAEFGRLDGSYLNAAVSDLTAPMLTELSERTWDEVHDLGLRGVWLNLRAQLPHLVKSGGGSIVIAGSVAGLVGGIGEAAYQAAKLGVIGLMRAAVHEFSPQGVRINVIAPGAVLTDGVAETFADNPGVRESFENHTPLRRVGQPQEIAEVAAWLLSDRSSYVTGATLPVDGGLLVSRL